MAEQQLRNVTGHVVIQSEFSPGAILRNVTGHVVIQQQKAGEALLRNVTGHVVIQSGLNPVAKLRNVTGHVVIQRDNTGRLTGGEAVWRDGDETTVAPHVDISQPMQLNLTGDYIDTKCTLLVMYSDGSFERRFVTPDQSPWTVPVTGEVNQLAFFRGELVPVTIEAIRRGMISRRFESDNPE